MWTWLWGRLLARAFGDGLGADIAGRGAAYLGREAKRAIDRDEVRLTRVRLRPGESYTVVARPPATRRERRLAARQRHLRERDERMTRPTRSQLRAARRLRAAQRRLDRRSPGTRRYERAARAEAERGERFDKVMRRTARHEKVRAELRSVTTELDASRDARYAEVHARRGRGRPRRTRVRVYD